MTISRLVGWGLIILTIPLGAMALGQSACACTPKRMAYRAVIKSDLRILAQVQLVHHDSTGRFSTDSVVSDLGLPSTGVTLDLGPLDSASWSAHAVHSDSEAGECWASSSPPSPAPPQMQKVPGGYLWCEPPRLREQRSALLWTLAAGTLLGGLALIKT